MMITRYVLPIRIWKFMISKSLLVNEFKTVSTNKSKEKILKISTNSAKNDIERKLELCQLFLTKFVRVRVIVEQKKGNEMDTKKIMDFAQKNVADKITESLYKQISPLKVQNESTVSFTLFPHLKQ